MTAFSSRSTPAFVAFALFIACVCWCTPALAGDGDVAAAPRLARRAAHDLPVPQVRAVTPVAPPAWDVGTTPTPATAPDAITEWTKTAAQPPPPPPPPAGDAVPPVWSTPAPTTFSTSPQAAPTPAVQVAPRPAPATTVAAPGQRVWSGCGLPCQDGVS
ncbi:MAG: hypothetical protein ACYTG6_14465, partial [Planctomycetota bacterium]